MAYDDEKDDGVLDPNLAEALDDTEDDEGDPLMDTPEVEEDDPWI